MAQATVPTDTPPHPCPVTTPSPSPYNPQTMPAAAAMPPAPPKPSRWPSARARRIGAWALYDCANSAFATTVVAGLFPAFYNVLSAELSVRDSSFWFNLTLAVSSLCVAMLAPLLGAIAEHSGRGRQYLAMFTFLGVLMCFALAWVGAGLWWVALLVYGLGQVGFAGGHIFYDAFLVEVAGDEVDVVSGLGYAVGYFGGGVLFLVNVLMVNYPAWFGFATTGTALAAAFISVGIWWFVFSLPLLLSDIGTRAAPPTQSSLRAGLADLRVAMREIRHMPAVLWFLGGYWLYIDGVGTLYRMAVFFAERVLGLPVESLITALLLTQFVAFPAALGFGWLGRWRGAKFGILLGLAVYVGVVLYAWRWLSSSRDFYLLAVAIGLVQGGVQSLSRSLFTYLIPPTKAFQFFGFYNMVGKFASIFGPALMAMLLLFFPTLSARDSILVLIGLFVAGGALLLKVKAPAPHRAPIE